MVRRGIVVAMFLILVAMFFGSLALPARSANSTSLDERKVHLIFCARSLCNYFGPTYDDCYCCPNDARKEYCHVTLEECRANCASCNPKCAP
ncbi:hypothetical protein GQ55_5G512600 [Panicum hallii var. hallii]|uniref:Embryo surrounding factor 1 brassicaceae domain-containing protein n=1 Tax=Panicum hallii var. hallii TaxID=1504633 RepID=A0A2T7DSC8_9POAL|nr:hypothetical protein GQ55_5G512600 [Panicum hallii var. hallii]